MNNKSSYNTGAIILNFISMIILFANVVIWIVLTITGIGSGQIPQNVKLYYLKNWDKYGLFTVISIILVVATYILIGKYATKNVTNSMTTNNTENVNTNQLAISPSNNVSPSSQV